MLGGSDDRPPLVDDATREQQSAPRGQYGVSVDHEGLLSLGVCVSAAPLHDRRPSLINDRYSVSSHLLDQPPLAVQLDLRGRSTRFGNPTRIAITVRSSGH